MDYLAFLLAVLQVHEVLGEEIVWDTTVELAENMTLECVYPSLGTVSQAEWFKIGTTKKESMVIFNPTYGLKFRKPYADRIYFRNSSKNLKDMTLSFRNASEADVGFYSCLLDTFPQGAWEKVVQVVPSDSFETNVSSNSRIVSEPGKNITLTCELQMKGPMQQVRWEKIQPHQIDHLTSCNLSQGRSYTSRYRRQILSNCSHRMRTTFLTMPQVMPADSGLYRCGFQANTGENETFVIALTVTDGKTRNQYVRLVGGVTALLLLFLIVIAPAIIIFNFRRKMRQKELQVKESGSPPNQAFNNYRGPISTTRKLDIAKEDIYVNYPAFSRRPKARV